MSLSPGRLRKVTDQTIPNLKRGGKEMSNVKQIYKWYFIGVICAIIGIGVAYGVCELVDKVIPNASPNTQLVIALLLLVIVGAIVIYPIYKLLDDERH